MNGRPSQGLPKPKPSECNAPIDFCPRSGFCKKIRRASVIGVIMASVITDVDTDLSNVFSIMK